MTAKQYLKQLHTVDILVESKLEQIERLKSLRERVTSTITGMPHGSTSEGQIADITARILELEQEALDKIAESVEMKAEARRRIEAIEDARYRAVLEARYLGNVRFDRIALDMHYSLKQIYKLHGWALQRLKIPEKYV